MNLPDRAKREPIKRNKAPQTTVISKMGSATGSKAGKGGREEGRKGGREEEGRLTQR
jgi:hypothetical protein